MNRRALVVATAVVAGALAPLAAAGPAPAGTAAPAPKISPALAAGLADLHAGETTTVLVTLRDQADLRATEDPARVVRQLQDFADREQAPLRDALADWRRAGAVDRVRPLWVTDAVQVTATAAVVRDVAARADVASVVPDTVELVPAQVAASAPAGPPTANVSATGADQVWARGDTGEGVVVASLDTGADLAHPDLQPRWRGGGNSWYDPYGQHPTSPVDLSGHGTAALGLVVGGDASGHAIGVAPGAQWIAARVFDDRGASSVTAVHQAFQWVLDPDHDPATDDVPDVVNASWSLGSPGCDETFRPDVQALVAGGILPVFAAGNFGPASATGASPANYPESLAVGAAGTNGQVLGLSSRGPDSCGGRTSVFPDLVAPGQDVETADLYGLWQTTSGTSVAAPQVAGVLALLLSARPGLAVAEQRGVLLGAAADLGPAGPDDTSGAGRVDAVAAWDAVTAPGFTLVAPAPPLPLAAGATADLAFTVSGEAGFTGDVQVTAGLPAGWAGAPAPALVSGGTGTVDLPVTVPADQVAGDYPVTLTATSGWRTRSATVTVTVTSPPPPPPPPPPVLELSTLGNVAPGVAGVPDDADVLRWDGTTLSRSVDASASPYRLGSGADVDGLVRTGDTSFLVSFADNVNVPGVGLVQDEDVVRWDGAAWSVWFDGTAAGLTSDALDLDEIALRDGQLWFSTVGATKVPGVAGTPDDADVYRWDGVRFALVWDASAAGLRTAADVDGLDVDAGGRMWLSFAETGTAVPGLGTVPDEDVVLLDGATWSTWFDGSLHGFTTDAADIDALDVE
ncbi:S8 family serine peptidase [Nocardioides taihuensis]|uniref:S8 family serine peptidase n=1 Tax=Nocardioides taihuensis TaxID=1835606 RepID=A0ABW0BJD5_9ACTN